MPTQNPHKMRLYMAIQNTEIFAEIMYNSNSNSCYTSRYTTHTAYTHNTSNSNSNIGNVNEIVKVSSNLSINAKCV